MLIATNIANGANVRVRTLANTDTTYLAVCSVYGTISHNVRVISIHLLRGRNNHSNI